MPTISIKKAAAPALEIHLLGHFEISVYGAPVERKSWRRRKPKQLVKLLALQPYRRLHREQVVDLLWPDADPESAANSLNKAIHAARLALEPHLSRASNSDFIVTEDQQVTLKSSNGLWIDAEEFERLAAESIKTSEPDLHEAALSLYRGELLAEDLYEEWTVARRERLRQTYLGLLKRLTRLWQERGRHERSIEILQSLTTADPTDEEACRDLMRLYALTGDKHRAFVQYRNCVEQLARELEIRPERATIDLYHAVVAGKVKPLLRGTHSTSSSKSISETHSSVLGTVTSERRQRTDRQRISDSIAVLPFINQSVDPRLSFLGDGLSESIIGRLSQLPQLRVIAWSSVSRYRGELVDLTRVSRDLEVRAVLTGSVSLVNDQLLVKVELADAMDGAALWSKQFNRLSSDMFAVQEEIARSVSEKLWLELITDDRHRLGKRFTENKGAFELYAKGRFCWNSRAADRLRQAIDYFEQAIALDPAYALAYSGLADCYSMLASYGAMAAPEGFGKAREFASRALELDDNLAEAHGSMGYVKALHDWEMERAERELRRAIELKPQEATYRQWLGIFLISVRGKIEDGLVELERARQNDPVSLISVAAVGWGLYFARFYDRAIEELAKAVDLDPNYYVAHTYLGRLYLQKGMLKESTNAFMVAHSLNPADLSITAEIAHLYALTGEAGRATEMLAQLTANAERKYISPYWVALIHLALGNIEQVFMFLEEAYAERSGYLFWLNVEPRFDCLRNDERFMDLLRRIGFYQAPSRVIKF